MPSFNTFSVVSINPLGVVRISHHRETRHMLAARLFFFFFFFGMLGKSNCEMRSGKQNQYDDLTKGLSSETLENL